MLSLFAPGSPEYAEAYQTMLRCSNDGQALQQVLQRLTAHLPRSARVADWGAGTGRITAWLCQRFDTVYAIEPSPTMQAEFKKANLPATLFAGTIADTQLPQPIDVGLINHVYYHIPDREWGRQTLHCAAQLTARGILLITLMHPDTDANQMLEAFGAPRLNIYGLLDVFREYPAYTITFQTAPRQIRTQSFADTLTVARFLLSDRDRAAFTRFPSTEEFETYVRRFFWDERQASGVWNHAEVFAIIERNPLL